MVRPLDEKTREIVINCGAFMYTPQTIANILSESEADVSKALKDEKTEYAQAYAKGRDTAQYLIDLKLFEMAKSGDLKALQVLERRQRMASR